MSNKEKQQKHLFKSFVNIHLKPFGRSIEEISDLSTGVDLFYLIRALKEKQGREFKIFSRMETKRLKMRIIQKNNVQQIITYLREKEYMKLHGIVADNVLDKDEKIIMALVWNIILHYHVYGNQRSEKNGKNGKKKHNPNVYEEIMEWMNLKLEEAGVPEKKMSTKNVEDWGKSDGLFHMTKHLFSKYSDKNKEHKLLESPPSDDHRRNYYDLLNFAREKMRIPSIMDPDDFLQDQDKMSLTTYVSFFRNYEIEEKKKIGEKDELENLESIKKEQKEKELRENELREKLKELRITNEDVKRALNDCEETRGRLKKTIGDLEDKYGEKEKENNSLRERLRKMESQLGNMRNKMGNLKDELSENRSGNDELQKIVSDLEKKKNKALQQKDKISNMLPDYEKRISNLQEELRDREDEKNKVNDFWKDKIIKLQKDYEGDMKKQKEEYEKEIEEKEDKISNLQYDQSKREKALQREVEDLRSIQKNKELRKHTEGSQKDNTIRDLNDEIQRLKEKMRDMEDENTSLQRDFKNIERDKNRLQENLDHIHNQDKGMSDEVQRLKDKISDVTQKYEDILASQKKTTRNKYTQTDDYIENLEAELKKKIKEIKKLKGELRDLKKKMVKTEMEKDTDEDKMKRLLRDKERKMKNLENLLDKKADSRDKFDEMERKLREELEQMRNEMKKRDSKIKEFMEDDSKNKEKIFQLERERDTLNKDLSGKSNLNIEHQKKMKDLNDLIKDQEKKIQELLKREKEFPKLQMEELKRVVGMEILKGLDPDNRMKEIRKKMRKQRKKIEELTKLIDSLRLRLKKDKHHDLMRIKNLKQERDSIRSQLQGKIQEEEKKSLNDSFDEKMLKGVRDVFDGKNLDYVKAKVLKLTKKDVNEIVSYRKPPLPIRIIVACTLLLLGREKGEIDDWNVCKKYLKDPKWLRECGNFEPKKNSNYKEVVKLFESLDREKVKRTCYIAEILYVYVGEILAVIENKKKNKLVSVTI